MQAARVARNARGSILPRLLGVHPTVYPGQLAQSSLPSASGTGLRLMSSDTAELPSVSDAGTLKALRAIMAYPWHPLSASVLAQAEAALKQTSDEVGKGALEKAKAAAEAVEAFGERLELLRFDLDDLSGGKFGGESVGKLPEHVKQALLSALRRYSAYLESFGKDEEWLKKKVQEELGTSLLQVKQRCSGLESEWNQVSLIGTSGLSGSYIEKRAKA